MRGERGILEMTRGGMLIGSCEAGALCARVFMCCLCAVYALFVRIPEGRRELGLFRRKFLRISYVHFER